MTYGMLRYSTSFIARSIRVDAHDSERRQVVRADLHQAVRGLLHLSLAGAATQLKDRFLQVAHAVQPAFAEAAAERVHRQLAVELAVAVAHELPGGVRRAP